MNESGPTTSFEAGATKRSAISVWLIHASTVFRNENTITLTPTVIATATANAAIVIEFRRSARERFAAPSSASIIALRRSRRSALNDAPAPALKCDVNPGTRKENPARTKNAAPKPSQAGPTASARKDKTPVSARESNPLIHHEDDKRNDLSRPVPPSKARTGSMPAAARAGNQADKRTEARPIAHAAANIPGSRKASFTLTRTYSDEIVSATVPTRMRASSTPPTSPKPAPIEPSTAASP